MQRATDLASRKRVWWCPIGPLSSLPLHASGTYSGSSQDNIGNYIISSYTPTMTALYRLLTKTPSFRDPLESKPKISLLAQPTSAGLAPLTNARIEVDLIKTVLPVESVMSLREGQGVLVGDALEDLKTAHVLHLACHGRQDQQNPLNSGFELEDGRLTLRQLMRLDTPNAQLAYLSACDSAGMDESRPDEGLNLVGAMIFAGFRSVIGTMW
jgi:CHAT domain-containing protein